MPQTWLKSCFHYRLVSPPHVTAKTLLKIMGCLCPEKQRINGFSSSFISLLSFKTPKEKKIVSFNEQM